MTIGSLVRTLFSGGHAAQPAKGAALERPTFLNGLRATASNFLRHPFSFTNAFAFFKSITSPGMALALGQMSLLQKNMENLALQDAPAADGSPAASALAALQNPALRNCPGAFALTAALQQYANTQAAAGRTGMGIGKSAVSDD